jgi:hypothetical protein
VLPLVHAALHGQLAWSALWAQHNENRMLVPNLAFVGLGIATKENVQVVMYVSAGVFIATFALFLVMFRSYVGRLEPRAVLATGVVWYSVVDWSNALWAFQLAWYLVLASLFGMLYLLLRDARWSFGGALACAVLASYSSLQGLFLWPLGLVCVMWVRPWSLRRVCKWVSAAIATAVVYFVNYQSAPRWPDNLSSSSLFRISNPSSISPSYALSHPFLTSRFFLVMIGDSFPLHFNASDPVVSEIIGLVMLIVAPYVVFRSGRQRIDFLPVGLISFGLLFDLVATIGRVKLGTLEGAFASRYSMSGLLIVVGILTYAWPRVRSRSLMAALGCLLALQVAVSATYGVEQSVANRKALEAGARIVANEEPLRGCAAFNAFIDFVPANLTYSFVQSMKTDQLNVFAPGPLSHYRAEGLPKLRPCTGF